MNPTALEQIQALITLANNLIGLVDTLLATERPQLVQRIVYLGAKFYVQLLVIELEQIARELAIQEIQQVVGIDFNAAALDDNALFERHALLPTITNLRDNYGVMLVGPTGETLGVWLSNPAADLDLVTTIFNAVDETAGSLDTQIASWSGGYLSSPADAHRSQYLQDLQNANSAQARFRLVVYVGAHLTVPLAPSSYTADPLKLFGYLNGWEYARFARRVIQIDHDIYEATYNAAVASRLWNSSNWLPTANALLRTAWTGVLGFTNRGITSIDPAQSLAMGQSPYDFIMAYRARTTECSPTQANARCHDNCYVPSVKAQTDFPENWAWAGSPQNKHDPILPSDTFLPFLPKSIITGCPPARRGLARATIALWNEMGIYQDYEEVTRLINLLEHRDTLNSPGARQTLFQFLHFIYHSTIPAQNTTRDEEYVAGMSSVILEFNNNADVDVRTYKFLMKMLTPIADQMDTQFASEYATEPLGDDLEWEEFDMSKYTTTVQMIISEGASRTFGSTEFNALTPDSRTALINQKANGEGWVAFFPAESENLINSTTGAPDGVFLMTPPQFDYAQGLP